MVTVLRQNFYKTGEAVDQVLETLPPLLMLIAQGRLYPKVSWGAAAAQGGLCRALPPLPPCLQSWGRDRAPISDSGKKDAQSTCKTGHLLATHSYRLRSTAAGKFLGHVSVICVPVSWASLCLTQFLVQILLLN